MIPTRPNRTPLTLDELCELKELRRKVRQVQIERDVLAKAAAWFARLMRLHGLSGMSRKPNHCVTTRRDPEH